MLASPDRRFDPGVRGGWLIPLTIVVAYIAGFVALGSELGLEKWLVLILLGGIHLALTRADSFFFGSGTPVKVGLYFLLNAAICAGILYLGQGVFWLILMPLASTAAAILSRWATAVFYALLLAIFILPFQWGNPSYAVQNLLIFGCALVFVWVFTEVSVRDQQARREVERLAGELEQANARLRESAAQAEELARSRERNRLAREIHDSLGHYLTVVNVQLEAARVLMGKKGWKQDAPDLAAALEKAQTLTRSGLADVRRSVAALRADPLGERPFWEAVQALIAENEEAGLLVSLRREGSARPAAPQTELALYRTLQEALTNVRKHARASKADVTVEYLQNSVRLEVADNGVGFSSAEDGEEKFGLRGIRERAEILHGTMEIGINPGGGVRLAVELPVGKGRTGT
ncbi:MAG: sensor histidine kinase [Anaerolineales bacterium]|nr:sensor histidine kinase [Anaerolineales bacterium]